MSSVAIVYPGVGLLSSHNTLGPAGTKLPKGFFILGVSSIIGAVLNSVSSSTGESTFGISVGGNIGIGSFLGGFGKIFGNWPG